MIIILTLNDDDDDDDDDDASELILPPARAARLDLRGARRSAGDENTLLSIISAGGESIGARGAAGSRREMRPKTRRRALELFFDLDDEQKSRRLHPHHLRARARSNGEPAAPATAENGQDRCRLVVL
jgi:hypothetical protein